MKQPKMIQVPFAVKLYAECSQEAESVMPQKPFNPLEKASWQSECLDKTLKLIQVKGHDASKIYPEAVAWIREYRESKSRLSREAKMLVSLGARVLPAIAVGTLLGSLMSQSGTGVFWNLAFGMSASLAFMLATITVTLVVAQYVEKRKQSAKAIS